MIGYSSVLFLVLLLLAKLALAFPSCGWDSVASLERFRTPLTAVKYNKYAFEQLINTAQDVHNPKKDLDETVTDYLSANFPKSVKATLPLPSCYDIYTPEVQDKIRKIYYEEGEYNFKKIRILGVAHNAVVPSWSDEFSGEALNMSKWQHDAGKEVHADNQIQHYLPSNAVLNGAGQLLISAKLKANGSYTSGRIMTKNKVAIQYGKVEARIKIPNGVANGLRPAFTLLSTSIDSVGGPACGEIAIMEYNGSNGNGSLRGSLRMANGEGKPVASTVVFNAGNETHSAAAADFHVYAIEWTPWAVGFFVDGRRQGMVELQSCDNTKPTFRAPFFFTLSMAIVQQPEGVPSPVGRHLPAEMVVDYVRVYPASFSDLGCVHCHQQPLISTNLNTFTVGTS